MTLGILLPTRGRPGNLYRFLEATVLTAVDWHLYLRLDYDDLEAQGYDRVLTDFKHYANQITVVHGKRVRFGPSLNELAARAERDGVSHVGMFGDDVLPVTHGWDADLVEALAVAPATGAVKSVVVAAIQEIGNNYATGDQAEAILKIAQTVQKGGAAVEGTSAIPVSGA